MRLIQKKFAAWLAEQPPEKIIGRNRDCHTCPLNRYYEAATGGAEIVISTNDEGYQGDRGYGDRPLPYWAAEFARRVDREAIEQITARRALEILDAIR